MADGVNGLRTMTTQGRERIVMGALLLGIALVAVAGMSMSGMDVNGREVPPSPAFAVGALVVGIGTLAACVWLAVSLLGRAGGLKVIRREFGAALFAGAIAGTLSGFIVRAIFPGPAVWMGLLIAYGAAVGTIYWFAGKATAA
ncbi:MAG: hypothetical protein EG823_07905 [Actinobacteria bacterium]|nr:hypothetical protein [Actinomycetota bacterium]